MVFSFLLALITVCATPHFYAMCSFYTWCVKNGVFIIKAVMLCVLLVLDYLTTIINKNSSHCAKSYRLRENRGLNSVVFLFAGPVGGCDLGSEC